MKRVVLAATFLMAPVALAAQGMASVEEAVNSITSEDIYRRISIIADDSMLGRDTPSPELEQVANYIAGQFYSFGLEPMGDAGSYLQRYPLTQKTWDPANSTMSLGDRTFTLGEDMQLVFSAGSPTGEESGDAVILSGTLTDPSQLASMELADRVVFIVAPTENGDFTRALGRMANAVFRTQAMAVVFVSDRSDEAFSAQGDNLSNPRISKNWGESGGGTAFLEVRDQDISSVLSAAGFDLADARNNTDRDISATDLGIQATLNLNQRVLNRTSAPNVVGFLEGSDPELRDEYVVFSAHMDHIGINPRGADGDTISNGADDDASGTTAVVELAEAFSMLANRPRRSMIFLTVSGEEKGLWGSEYFSENLPVPAEQIVANINIDMVGRNWPDSIVVIGKEHSDLGETLNRVNAAHPELNMVAMDDIWPEERFYFRSDHFNFAQKGIPILFFFNGTHDDYHGVGDEVDKIDTEKESRIVRLNFHLGLEIANADDRPRWNPESYEQIVNTSE